MYLTWLDSNSWLIELADQRILLDPWLVGPLTFGNLDWLFKGSRLRDRPTPDFLDLILLSQGLEDHTHPPTLRQLDRAIPVVGSASAAKVARSLGYTQVTALAHGETFLHQHLRIQATPGSLLGPLVQENGYLLTDLTEGTCLYYEPHGYHASMLQAVGSVDVVITPLIDLALPLVGPIIKGSDSALQVAQWLQPKVLLPTATGGDITFEGMLMTLLQAKGNLEELRSRLAQHNLPTQILEPKPGKRFQPLPDPVLTQ